MRIYIFQHTDINRYIKLYTDVDAIYIEVTAPEKIVKVRNAMLRQSTNYMKNKQSYTHVNVQ